MKKAFTVIEIMIVVVILGLLAVMAVPAFNKVRRQSQTHAIQQNLELFAKAGQQYLTDKGVTQVGYTQLLYSGKLPYLKPVAGENYFGLNVVEGATLLSTTATGDLRVSYTY
jgi:type IV pilus assembly protein PilA